MADILETSKTNIIQREERKKLMNYFSLNKIKSDFILNKGVYFMALPIILYYLIFYYIPMLGNIIAFKYYTPMEGIFGSKWVGLKNFIDFFNNYYTFRIIKNTLLLNIYEILWAFPAPIIFALLLNEIQSKKFKRYIQTTSYLPHFISMVVICGLVIDFCSSKGLITNFLSILGFEKENLLMRKEYFRTIYITSGIWQQVGWGSIIYIAALSGIDVNMYEASVIDGANRLKRLIYITLPSLLPTIIILLIIRIGYIMSSGFEKIFLLYNPLTYDTADVISTFVYRKGLLEFDYSYSAAVGLFNSIINFITIIGANKLSRKATQESLW